MILFKKQYDGESIYDLDRDLSESICEDYNELVSQIPVDDHGIQLGTFTVTIDWKNDE